MPSLYNSGLTYTVLQPAMFMRNIEAVLATDRKATAIRNAIFEDKEACYVDYHDVAEVAAIALTSDVLGNGTFELCAAGMFSRIEVAKLMGDGSGHAGGCGRHHV